MYRWSVTVFTVTIKYIWAVTVFTVTLKSYMIYYSIKCNNNI